MGGIRQGAGLVVGWLLAQNVGAAVAPPQAQSGIKVVVSQGEGYVHNVQQPTPISVVVEVRDSNDRPVSGAVVLFQLPISGPSGTFANDSPIDTLTTDAQGRAAAQGLRPNSLEGKWQITVTASHKGTSVTVTITQINQAPCPAGTKRGPDGKCVKGRGGLIAVVILGGAGVAAAVLIGRRDPTPTPGPMPTPTPTGPRPTTVTLGGSTVSPP